MLGIRTRHVVALAAAAPLWLVASAAAAEVRGAGPPVDVSFHRADLGDVLRFFADVGDVNIVCDDEVSGQVTLSLREVPWDMALRVTLLTVGLDMEWVGEVIHVGTAETLAARRQARLERRQQCLESGPLRTTVIRLSHARAADILPVVQASLSPRGRAVVDERTNAIVVRDVDCP